VAQEKVLPLILKTGKDQVPNVRFTVIKILKTLHFKSDTVKQLLNDLSNDPDRDVSFFAQDALNSYWAIHTNFIDNI